MASVIANGIQIEYETHGSSANPVVLMIMGLGAQLIYWPSEMIAALVDSGFRVVTFDNRDVGLSHKMHGHRAPNAIMQSIFGRLGIRSPVPYSLQDMVQDAEGLLNELQIERAHIVGASMGGMIAQLFAATKANRTQSLTSIMSTTGNPKLPRPSRKVATPLLFNRREFQSQDDIVDNAMRLYAMIGTPGSPQDLQEMRQRVEAGISRSYYPAGVRRQVAAIIASGDLRPKIRSIKAPTLIIHGADDPLAPAAGGVDCARNIRGARLEIIDGMAHDLPRSHISRLNGLITAHIQNAEVVDREHSFSSTKPKV